jgi:trans-aconitate 2-methyltransferase
MAEWDAAGYSRISSLQKAMAEEVLGLLELDGSERILDVGCGEGKITAEIAGRVADRQVVGIDPSHDMIRFACDHFPRERFPNLRFEVADARSLPFRDEFDLAVSFNALHWIPDQETALRSIRSTLKIGGKAQLRLVPTGPRKSLETVVEETRRSPRWSSYFAGFSDPYLRLTAKEYATLAQSCGFRVVNVSTRDVSWDFESRAAFAAFSAVGCVAWTSRLPAAKRTDFIDDVLNRYPKEAGNDRGEESVFRFYQMDISLLAS